MDRIEKLNSEVELSEGEIISSEHDSPQNGTKERCVEITNEGLNGTSHNNSKVVYDEIENDELMSESFSNNRKSIMKVGRNKNYYTEKDNFDGFGDDVEENFEFSKTREQCIDDSAMKFRYKKIEFPDQNNFSGIDKKQHFRLNGNDLRQKLSKNYRSKHKSMRNNDDFTESSNDYNYTDDSRIKDHRIEHVHKKKKSVYTVSDHVESKDRIEETCNKKRDRKNDVLNSDSTHKGSSKEKSNKGSKNDVKRRPTDEMEKRKRRRRDDSLDSSKKERKDLKEYDRKRKRKDSSEIDQRHRLRDYDKGSRKDNTIDRSIRKRNRHSSDDYRSKDGRRKRHMSREKKDKKSVKVSSVFINSFQQDHVVVDDNDDEKYHNLDDLIEQMDLDENEIVEKRRLERQKIIEKYKHDVTENNTNDNNDLCLTRCIIDTVIDSSTTAPENGDPVVFESIEENFEDDNQTSNMISIPSESILNQNSNMDCTVQSNMELTVSNSLVDFEQVNNDNEVLSGVGELSNQASLKDPEGFDMFAEMDVNLEAMKRFNGLNIKGENETKELHDNWDDSEGYYNATIGEIMDNKYSVYGYAGKGVFSSVVRARDINDHKNEVVIKTIRNNHLMKKQGYKELEILQRINEFDKENKYHCVILLGHFHHSVNLRQLLRKYGNGIGLNMKAVRSYSLQLFQALKLLKRIGIIHADIKPDNVLVNHQKNLLKVCDFGSACYSNDVEATPYLVSRFYRAPEIILGLNYDCAIDLWSVGCTLFEVFTARILFAAKTNNEMLKLFMDLKGKLPHKMIRKSPLKFQHFDENLNFLYHEFNNDHISVITSIYQKNDMIAMLSRNQVDKSNRKLIQLKDLLDKIFTLDPVKRITVNQCTLHPFITEKVHD